MKNHSIGERILFHNRKFKHTLMSGVIREKTDTGNFVRIDLECDDGTISSVWYHSADIAVEEVLPERRFDVRHFCEFTDHDYVQCDISAGGPPGIFRLILYCRRCGFTKDLLISEDIGVVANSSAVSELSPGSIRNG